MPDIRYVILFAGLSVLTASTDIQTLYSVTTVINHSYAQKSL